MIKKEKFTSFPQISTNDREKILRHNWWGHDGRWYMFVAKELGFEKANEMNMKINKAIGKLEIKSIMAISGILKIRKVGPNCLKLLKCYEYSTQGYGFILFI